jgi:two-component system NtrC family sensor kinase
MHDNPMTNEEILESIERCKRQVKRCGDITSKMLQFSRKSDTVLRTTDIASKLNDVVSLMRKQAQVRDIDLSVQFEHTPSPPLARIDASEFEQVIVNLINNSMHAIKRGGFIALSVKRSQNEIVITVSDNGAGIAPDDMDKIFQPFFTTKAPGEGTGLGLSVCYGMVQGWGGTIEASSMPGKGTDMIVRLPAVLHTSGDDELNGAISGRAVDGHGDTQP